MNLQERIDFLLHNPVSLSVKRKHLLQFSKHLEKYSNDAGEIAEAQKTIREAIAHIDTLTGFEYPDISNKKKGLK